LKFFPFLEVQEADHQAYDSSYQQEQAAFNDCVLPDHGVNIPWYREWIEKNIPESIS
jgi:hypothetical protein